VFSFGSGVQGFGPCRLFALEAANRCTVISCNVYSQHIYLKSLILQFQNNARKLTAEGLFYGPVLASKMVLRHKHHHRPFPDVLECQVAEMQSLVRDMGETSSWVNHGQHMVEKLVKQVMGLY